jgi:isopenicillin N synthase-like dioxygenase
MLAITSCSGCIAPSLMGNAHFARRVAGSKIDGWSRPDSTLMSVVFAAPRPATRTEVPVLDLTPLLRGERIDALARDLHHACTTTGFFYVANHGVARSIVDGVFDATRRYFALPLEERMNDRMDDRFRRGFMPYGINPHPGYDPDLKESYEIGVDLPPDDPDVRAGRPLHAPNRWPADKPWLRVAAEPYFTATLELGKALLRLFAVALGEPEPFFLQWCKKTMAQSRLFHYPPQRAPENEQEWGVAPHTDYGMITLLLQDPIGGLELRKRDGEWIGAPYIEDTYVVNLGDLCKVWTNDVYVSNLHRVVNRSGRERYSIPMFFNLDYGAPVRPLRSCVSAENPARYEPIASGDYLVGRFRDVQKLKAAAGIGALRPVR